MPHGFDEAISSARRQFEPLTYTFQSLLRTHTSTALYRIVPPEEGQAERPRVRVFHHNNSLWEEMIRLKRLHHGACIELNSFFLFEWFPRSPGLYWTHEGQLARQDAQSRIIKAERGSIVYNPYGKQSMLDGGIGNIRLGAINLNGRDWMLMSASSSGVCHQGFPVALPLDMYSKYIDEIRSRGAVVCSVVGEMKMIPEKIGDLYLGYTGVPKLYLQVENVVEPTQRKSRSMEELNVSVAVSFQGTVNRKLGVYATYVTFDPRRPQSFREAVKWMGDEYVRLYDGIVLTDFDEQENHFPEARFSLKKVMHLELTRKDFLEKDGLQIHIYNVKEFIAHQERIERLTNYKVYGGNVGALGDNASAKNVRQTVTSQSMKERVPGRKSTRPKRRRK